jgi:SIR2-like domain
VKLTLRTNGLGNMPELKLPQVKELSALANALTLARDTENGGRGRSIFLVGAGCSQSADIPLASGVARHCALKLAKVYSNGAITGGDADAALTWLIENDRTKDREGLVLQEDGSHWAGLYSYFFESHLNSPNQQRDVINEIIDQAGDALNWAHACLGELVHLRYVHTVLTTNFDQLILQGIIRTGELPVIADGLEALNRIVGKPRRPQVVHLHGSMHTYNLRNSRAALNETRQDTGATAMIMTLLQQCDHLVVVGYGGGEEGIMELLGEAARALPQLVIYWVNYLPGLEGLPQRALNLLSGENKFVIFGGPADKFFGDLMGELRIGAPRWVSDPIGVLKDQSGRLKESSAEFEDIRILVRAFKERVAFADQPDHRWPEANHAKVKAAGLRAAGAFREAQAQLETLDLEDDAEAARLHGLNLISIFEDDPDSGGADLDRAIAEFEGLIGRTSGAERLENILSLCAALIDKSEVTDLAEGVPDPALQALVTLAQQWQPDYTAGEYQAEAARLQVFLAQALLRNAERTDDAAELANAEAALNLAIERLTAAGDREGLLPSTRAGLAGVLQLIGAKKGDAETLRRAVALQRELVDSGPTANRGREDAGPLENLAEGLVALAEAVPDPEHRELLIEAQSVMTRAVGLYERGGDTGQLQAARVRLAEIAALL